MEAFILKSKSFKYCTVLIAFITVGSAHALNLEEQTLVYDSYALEKTGDIPKAIEKMVLALQKSPKDYYCNIRLGWLFFLNKKYKNSLDHYSQAYSIEKNSLEPLLGMSQVYQAAEAHPKTKKACELVLAKDPKNYICLQRLIFAEIQMKEFTPALASAKLAHELYPTDPVFLEQYAVLLKQNSQESEAKTILSLLLLVSPQNEYARSQLVAKK